MIPQEVVKLTDDLYFGCVGSRNKDLLPNIIRFWGMGFRPAENIAIIYLINAHCEQLLKDFAQNGRIAITFTRSPGFQAYQLKGQVTLSRAMTKAEMAYQREYQAKAVDMLMDFNYPKTVAKRWNYQADLAIEFKVEQLFDQTPGPKAGKVIDFA